MIKLLFTGFFSLIIVASQAWAAPVVTRNQTGKNFTINGGSSSQCTWAFKRRAPSGYFAPCPYPTQNPATNCTCKPTNCKPPEGTTFDPAYNGFLPDGIYSMKTSCSPKEFAFTISAGKATINP
jgi:hypothetical protein